SHVRHTLRTHPLHIEVDSRCSFLRIFYTPEAMILGLSHSLPLPLFVTPRRTPSQNLGRLSSRSFPFRKQSELMASRPFQSIREYFRAFRDGIAGTGRAYTLYLRLLLHRLTLRQAVFRRIPSPFRITRNRYRTYRANTSTLAALMRMLAHFR